MSSKYSYHLQWCTIANNSIVNSVDDSVMKRRMERMRMGITAIILIHCLHSRKSSFHHLEEGLVDDKTR